MGGDRAPEEIVAGALAAASADVVPDPLRAARRARAARGRPRDRPRRAGRRHGREAVGRRAREARELALPRLPRGARRHRRRGRRRREHGRHARRRASSRSAACRTSTARRSPLPIPALGGPSILIDAGANADARPEHLVQFAHMGAVFAEEIVGLDEPDRRAPLHRRGAREGQQARPRGPRRARRAPGELHFVGNVEGRDLLRKAADVVVCDGFTGNMALKLLEGTIQTTLAGLPRRGHGLRCAASSAGSSSARPRAACGRASTRTPTAAPTCSACAGSSSSRTATRPRPRSPTPSATRRAG